MRQRRFFKRKKLQGQQEAVSRKVSLSDYACILSPVVTEKSSILQGAEGGSVVAFFVDRRADKFKIKGAIERIFEVEVAAVRTCNRMGKLKRTTRAVGRTKQYKKAYVTLKPGFSIGIIEGV